MTITLDLESPTSRRTLSNISLAVAKSKKIVVMTGAGISCSCGIPDFRSSDGLYNLVKEQYPDVVLKGRDLFDASLFRDPTSTSVFYTFISQLKRSIDGATPSPTHAFLKTLDTKRKLLRSYTQNIDGLEERSGLLGSSSNGAKAVGGKGKGKIRVKEVRNVQLHGDIHRVRCTFCSAELACTEEYMEVFERGQAPDCPECSARSQARLARSARPLKVGTLRPAIVLYDEPHPLGDDIGTIQTTDLNRKPDLLLIMGTSLKVHGFKKLVKEFAKAVHAHPSSSSSPSATSRKKSVASGSTSSSNLAGKVIFVNKTAPSGSEWEGIIDYHVMGGSDEWVTRVLEDWKRMRPSDWEIQKTLVGSGEQGMNSFKVVKEVAGPTKPTSATKKKPEDMENIPPAPEAFVEPTRSLPTPPSSPSKRRQTSSHYCEGENSPSKKRLSCVPHNIEFAERGMLFADTTNRVDVGGVIDDRDDDYEDEDLEMDLGVGKAKAELKVVRKPGVGGKVKKVVVGKAAAAKKIGGGQVKTTPRIRKPRTQVYVELESTRRR
ncbi:hypothetical protein JAAARDRAFT_187428 [Jaapia argillacea MUCL 33604]|uniref:Deacetylase sirtuin-type domain-containing protein n=1 Tax=Jaapia argillacea MUCL 33604 TaxID=933084 RepID=A0A067QKL1_9AGAM|nr:hypothetical protein JAAARDRAFT_187428 [Jaapia argillacea MUCL 33604]